MAKQKDELVFLYNESGGAEEYLRLNTNGSMTARNQPQHCRPPSYGKLREPR